MKKLLLVLLVPTFSFFLQPGIHSMHDPHLFRQYEFSIHCMAAWSIASAEYRGINAGDEARKSRSGSNEDTPDFRPGGFIPCRWAPDSGLGYGEPLFTFYGQIPYWIGHMFYSLGFSLIASLKATLVLSLVLSAIAMYVTARSMWGKSAGMVAAILYTYAPYRAVDVWVRGNLNEAWAFVLLPLLLHFSRTKKWLWFAITLSLLIVTHNLSFVMFAPFLLAWILFHHRTWRPLFNFAWASLLALALSAFYLLPVVLEGHLVTLKTITEGYFNYQLHFATLNQLFISRFWGYGASLWGPQDDLSFSVGHLQWIIALCTIFLLPKFSLQNRLQATCYLLFALFAIFMTHGKSLFIWQLVPPLAFIQFPWRFLEIACVFAALLGGLVASKLSRYFKSLIIVLALILSAPYFITNDWRPVTDSEFFSGDNWINQMSTSLKDYWPTSATTYPDKPAPLHVEFATRHRPDFISY